MPNKLTRAHSTPLGCSVPSDTSSSCLHGNEKYSANKGHRGTHRERQIEEARTVRAEGAQRRAFIIILWTSLSHRGCRKSQQMETRTYVHLIVETPIYNSSILFQHTHWGAHLSDTCHLTFLLFPMYEEHRGHQTTDAWKVCSSGKSDDKKEVGMMEPNSCWELESLRGLAPVSCGIHPTSLQSLRDLPTGSAFP